MKLAVLFVFLLNGVLARADAKSDILEGPYGQKFLCLKELKKDFNEWDPLTLRQPQAGDKRAIVATAFGIYSVDISKINEVPRVVGTIQHGAALAKSLKDSTRARIEKQVLLGSTTHRISLQWPLDTKDSDLPKIVTARLPEVTFTQRPPEDSKLQADPVPSRSIQDANSEKYLDSVLEGQVKSFADTLVKLAEHREATKNIPGSAGLSDAIQEECKADKRFPKFSKALEALFKAQGGAAPLGEPKKTTKAAG